MSKKSIILISSCGGHLKELLQLEPLFKKYDYHLITEKCPPTTDLRYKYPNKVNYLLYGTRHNMLIYPFILLINCFISLFLFIKYNPKFIITTGTHTAGPMCCIAKLFRRKVIYIETFANIHTKTATGRLIYKIADLFIVQWPSMLEQYPNAICAGWIF